MTNSVGPDDAQTLRSGADLGFRCSPWPFSDEMYGLTVDTCRLIGTNRTVGIFPCIHQINTQRRQDIVWTLFS